MDTIKIGRHVDQLRNRRDQVVMTLRHLEKEHTEVERNTDWLDQAAYESRVRFLDRVTSWYIAELDQIDKALARAESKNYGQCAACHQPVEDQRLDAAPESEFCSACQDTREGLQSVSPRRHIDLRVRVPASTRIRSFG
jgi:RNA polymerase-binding transcription factor DksA